LDAFKVVDTVLKKCNGGSCITKVDAMDFGGDKPHVDNADKAEDSNFNPCALEEVSTGLYNETKCTKLVEMILFLNACIIHGVSYSFANKMFIVLQAHILPKKNCLPKNHYVPKLLTKKLELVYDMIHACKSGCVFFRRALVDAEKCTKCKQRRYKDVEQKKFLVKVL
jgi:hypothetical protein